MVGIITNRQIACEKILAASIAAEDQEVAAPARVNLKKNEVEC